MCCRLPSTDHLQGCKTRVVNNNDDVVYHMGCRLSSDDDWATVKRLEIE